MKIELLDRSMYLSRVRASRWTDSFSGGGRLISFIILERNCDRRGGVDDRHRSERAKRPSAPGPRERAMWRRCRARNNIIYTVSEEEKGHCNLCASRSRLLPDRRPIFSRSRSLAFARPGHETTIGRYTFPHSVGSLPPIEHGNYTLSRKKKINYFPPHFRFKVKKKEQFEINNSTQSAI